MAKYNKLAESKFNAIKKLLDAGATYKECAECVGVTESVVYRVRCCESYKEYTEMNAAHALKQREDRKAKNAKTTEPPAETVKEVRQTVTIQATHYMMEELRKTNELLTAISAKLAFIVDELTK